MVHTHNVWHLQMQIGLNGQVNVLDSTSNNFYLTGLQFEVGSAATDFEHRSFAEEFDFAKDIFSQLTIMVQQ